MPTSHAESSDKSNSTFVYGLDKTINISDVTLIHIS